MPQGADNIRILLDDVPDIYFRYVFTVRVRNLLLLLCWSCRGMRLLIIVLLIKKKKRGGGGEKGCQENYREDFVLMWRSLCLLPPPPLLLSHCPHCLNVVLLHICRGTKCVLTKLEAFTDS